MNTIITIKCKCGQVIDIDLAKVKPVFEIVETHEKNMGLERCHEASFPELCPKCKAKINIKVEVWQYPEGAFSKPEIKVEDGELVHGCEVCPVY